MALSVAADVARAAGFLPKNPATASALIASLALSIGANTAVFMVVDAIWLQPPPVSAPDRLAVVYRPSATGAGLSDSFVRSVADQVQRACTACGEFAVEAVSAPLLNELAADLSGGPAVPAMGVSWNYFQVLGVSVRGRPFAASDAEAGADPVVIISDNLWRGRLQADRTVLGRVVAIGATRATIVGIAPPRFRGPRLADTTDVWVPLAVAPRLIPLVPSAVFSRNPDTFVRHRLIVRVAQATDLPIAEGQIQTVDHKLSLKSLLQLSYPVRAQPGERADARLASLLAVNAAFVLVIGCLNLGSLFIARFDGRRTEIAVRLALGCGRGRLLRLLTFESLLVCLVGAVAALGAAWVGIAGLQSSTMPSGIQISSLPTHVGVRVAVFVVALGVVAAMLAGLLPAWRATSAPVSSLLAGQTRLLRRARLGLRGLLLSAHVALTMVLLVGVALLQLSARNARELDLGFDREHVAFVRVRPNLAAYATNDFRDMDYERRDRCRQRFLARVIELHGVIAATDGAPPLKPGGTSLWRAGVPLIVDGRDLSVADTWVERTAGPHYCEVLGIRLLEGRDFASTDFTPNAEHVAVVGRGLADRLWPKGPAVGRSFVARIPAPQLVRVIGVAEDAVRLGLRGPRVMALYLAERRDEQSELFRIGYEFVVRTSVPADSVILKIENIARQEFIDPSEVRVVTPNALLAAELREARLAGSLFLYFAAIGVTLALTGVWALVSYTAQQSVRECAIRLALGAAPSHISALIVRRSLVPVVVGCLAGLLMAIGSARALRAYLFGVGGVSGIVLLAAVVVIMGASAATTWRPARKAARRDPWRLLREL